MYNLVRHAAIQLNDLDGKETVKIAGVLRRLKNIFKQIVDTEYSIEVDRIRDESASLKSTISELNDAINQLLSSIKDGDVDAYDVHLTKVRELSVDLSQELKRLIIPQPLLKRILKKILLRKLPKRY